MVVEVSRAESIMFFRNRISQKLRVPEFLVRFWKLEENQLEAMGVEETMSSCKVTSESEIILEIGNINGSWPLDSANLKLIPIKQKLEERIPGVIGLFNLGSYQKNKHFFFLKL